MIDALNGAQRRLCIYARATTMPTAPDLYRKSSRLQLGIDAMIDDLTVQSYECDDQAKATSAHDVQCQNALKTLFPPFDNLDLCGSHGLRRV